MSDCCGVHTASANNTGEPVMIDYDDLLFSRQVIFGERFICIQMQVLPVICGLSRWVVSHASGQVLLYITSVCFQRT